jgi:hypothetical protein
MITLANKRGASSGDSELLLRCERAGFAVPDRRRWPQLPTTFLKPLMGTRTKK